MRRLPPVLSALALCASSAQAAEPTVSLLNMGQAPQARLQTSTADVVRSLALVIDTKVTMQIGAMAIPTVLLPSVVLNLAWRATGPKSELIIEAVDVPPAPGANPVVADQLRAATAALVGKSVRAAAAAPSAGGSPVVAQTLAELGAVLADLMVPLPLEPVGVSAQWEVIRAVEHRGVKAVERAVYDLVERDGQTIRVKVALDVGANPQELDGGARLVDFEGRGTGEIVLRLDQPGPVDGSIVVFGTMKLLEKKQTLVLHTETTVKLSSL